METSHHSDGNMRSLTLLRGDGKIKMKGKSKQQYSWATNNCG